MSRRSFRRVLMNSSPGATGDDVDKTRILKSTPEAGKGGLSVKCQAPPVSSNELSPHSSYLTVERRPRAKSTGALDMIREAGGSTDITQSKFKIPIFHKKTSPRPSICSSSDSRRTSSDFQPIPESALHEFILRACTLMALENPELKKKLETKQQELQLEKQPFERVTSTKSLIKDSEGTQDQINKTLGDPLSAEDEDGGVLRKLNDLKLRLGWLKKRSENHSVRPLPEEAQTWADDFHTLMSSKYGQSLFKAFLQREFSEENVEFWLAVEDYKNTRSGKLQAKASKIHNDYVAIQSPKEINLDSATRLKISSSLESPDKSLFDQAQKRVQTLMESDAYLRFLQSELYKELLNPETDSNEESS